MRILLDECRRLQYTYCLTRIIIKAHYCAHCARNNDTQMKIISGIMSNQSKQEYIEARGPCSPSRNRAGKSVMIDEVSDTLGWDRKRTIKAIE